MPYLKLVESASHAVTEARSGPVRIGREPGSTIVVGGDAAKVVSTRHAEARYEGTAWVLTDLGSRNGTYLNGRRLAAPAALTVGDVIRLGESGPEFKVLAVTEGLAATQPEHPGNRGSYAEAGGNARLWRHAPGGGHGQALRGARYTHPFGAGPGV